MWGLYDDKTDRLVYVGSEKECEEYTKAFPETKFYMVDLQKDKKENNKCDTM